MMLFIIFLALGCNNINFVNLNLQTKGKIKNVLSFKIKNVEKLNKFIKELKLEKHIEKFNYLKEDLKNNRILNGKDILIDSIKNDKHEIVKLYCEYQKDIFDFECEDINYFFELIFENLSIKCLEFLNNLYNEKMNSINFNKYIYSIIYIDRLKPLKKYEELKKIENMLLEEETLLKKSILKNPSLNKKDYLLFTLGGLNLLQSNLLRTYVFKNTSNIFKLSLYFPAVIAIFTPTYYYYNKLNKFSLYNKKINDKKNELNNIRLEMDEIRKNIEVKELKILKYLVENFNVSININILKECKKRDKIMILNYLESNKIGRGN